jgi:cell division protein FtsW (lipid II flippase)
MLRIRLWSALSSALTVSIGLMVLIGLLIIPDASSPNNVFIFLNRFAELTLQLTTITIALTMLIGVLNLLIVHTNRLRKRERSAIYSIVLLVSFGVAVGTYLFSREDSLIILDTVQFSVESALSGIVFFALVYGAYRMLHNQLTWARTLFVVVVIFMLIVALPFANVTVLHPLRDWLLAVPVSAGTRGLLLGIALGTVITGVRVLIGVDRSYRE